MELQTAFYIVGLVFMGLMIILIVALLAAVLVIKAKVDKVHDMVNERVDQVKSLGSKVSLGLAFIRRFVKN